METAEISQIFKALPFIKNTGAKHLWFDFDDEADVLYISFERPQNATDTDFFKDDILLRLREDKIVGITITNASKRIESLS
jgi:uncharacterized protein YuzE